MIFKAKKQKCPPYLVGCLAPTFVIKFWKFASFPIYKTAGFPKNSIAVFLIFWAVATMILKDVLKD